MNHPARGVKRPVSKSGGATPDDIFETGTTPSRPDWSAERDAGHLWSAISSLREKTGEMVSASNTCTASVEAMRADIKALEGETSGLKTEQQSTAKSIKLVSLVATPLLAAIAFVAPYFWSNAMRPDLERTISAQVKADIEKEQAVRENTRKLETKIQELEARLLAQPK